MCPGESPSRHHDRCLSEKTDPVPSPAATDLPRISGLPPALRSAPRHRGRIPPQSRRPAPSPLHTDGGDTKAAGPTFPKGFGEVRASASGGGLARGSPRVPVPAWFPSGSSLAHAWLLSNLRIRIADTPRMIGKAGMRRHAECLAPPLPITGSADRNASTCPHPPSRPIA